MKSIYRGCYNSSAASGANGSGDQLYRQGEDIAILLFKVCSLFLTD